MNKIPCLYCHTENEQSEQNCTHCGMPLAKKHPGNRQHKVSFFFKAFWGIVLFCVVMMFFLPR